MMVMLLLLLLMMMLMMMMTMMMISPENGKLNKYCQPIRFINFVAYSQAYSEDELVDTGKDFMYYYSQP